jgi:hypothetical protein
MKPRVVLPALLAALGTGALLACPRDAPPPSGSAARRADARTQEASAEQLVRRFFAALPTQDCAQLMPLVASLQTSEQCQEFLHDWGRSATDLDAIVRSAVDGRDPTAVLVTVRVRGSSGMREMVLRVESHHGQPQLRI